MLESLCEGNTGTETVENVIRQEQKTRETPRAGQNNIKATACQGTPDEKIKGTPAQTSPFPNTHTN